MKKSKAIAMLGVVGSLAVVLIILSINMQPYLTVSQVVEDPERFDEQEIQVKGIVKNYDGGDFNLTEDGKKIEVKVDDVTVPDDLENGIEVVVTGKFDAKKVLTATEILTQCS